MDKEKLDLIIIIYSRYTYWNWRLYKTDNSSYISLKEEFNLEFEISINDTINITFWNI